MNLKLILFAISIIQFSVCHPLLSNGSSHFTYGMVQNHGSYISYDCDGAVYQPHTGESLKEDVNISSIAAVSFQNCEISKYSDIFDQFPNVSHLAFLRNNKLPSVDFSNFDQLSLFVNVRSKLQTGLTSLSINAANLELLRFEADANTDITSISLKNATKLKHFYLENTVISSVPDDLFKDSTNLKTVSFPKNKIENIDSINWPNSLRLMDFSSNKISQLTNSSFKSASNLQILRLSGNEISNIDAEIFSQPNNLVILDLSVNHIKEISKTTFQGLNNLILADLRQNDIHYIEDGAFEPLSKLFELDLSRNNISSLNQKMFAGLNSLFSLELGSFSVRELTPESFGNLSQLRILDMSNGSLETIDFNSFAYLPKLGHVNLANNQISRLVKMAPVTWNINGTTNNTLRNDMYEMIGEVDLEWMISYLNIGWQFEYRGTKRNVGGLFDESGYKDILVAEFFFLFPELEKGSNYGLKKLILSTNLLNEIEKNIFSEFKSLKELDLSWNPIITLHPESFAGLNELELLHLTGCKLSSIDFSIFTPLTKLEELDLSSNKLQTIAAAPLPSIKYLQLNDNKLAEFPMKKSDFPNLETFNIINNPVTKLDQSFTDWNSTAVIETRLST